jgi:hypothetical protein
MCLWYVSLMQMQIKMQIKMNNIEEEVYVILPIRILLNIFNIFIMNLL